ncbi:CDP-alcohol phosphatidyltransferase family protein [Planctomyces sp. SH-PL62]|uniref:CDP-alcohol phosphatidyltransferase family protein n=1 Tax=Planctomyces sp. SH-PL62 TaxID=1636152 RepID=UPI00078BE888|nr:CDP-alcohol phosphatidyltransferase family protein [Planctomyces sp. SH-PL62]AMV39616.1 CDP-alcohol phosphatidyltransferase [Planctomyces sp. SH-PL62]
MSADRPTLRQLRAVVQKGRHREIGNWLARLVARPSAVYGTWAAVRAGASAHQVTSAAVLAGLASATAIGTGDRWGFVAGAALAHLAFWLDHVDGQVARWRGSASLDGVYYDYLMHHVLNMATGFALGFGLAARTGEVGWAAAGFLIALGWALLGLHNDCRYKAFIQRLKSTGESYRVDGGAGGRPAPAPGWPRRGLGVVAYPAYKACEPHVVLLGLSGLAALAAIAPVMWETCWRIGVGGMAAAAPTLAAARIRRSIERGATEAEFHAWFRPIDEASRHRPLDATAPDVVSTGSMQRESEAA